MGPAETCKRGRADPVPDWEAAQIFSSSGPQGLGWEQTRPSKGNWGASNAECVGKATAGSRQFRRGGKPRAGNATEPSQPSACRGPGGCADQNPGESARELPSRERPLPPRAAEATCGEQGRRAKERRGLGLLRVPCPGAGGRDTGQSSAVRSRLPQHPTGQHRWGTSERSPTSKPSWQARGRTVLREVSTGCPVCPQPQLEEILDVFCAH